MSFLTRRPWIARASLTAAAGLAAYEYDKHLQASAVARTVRTFRDIAIICIDYKVNFRVERGVEYLNQIHERAARRLLSCCRENGGLFIKFGQSIAIQSSLLPPAFGRELSILYDNAPFVPVSEIAPVVERNFPGKTLDDLFVDFSEEAVASASVAQVHTARLRSDPSRVVAVKVQKPEIKLQIAWDLFAFRTCARLIEGAFGIPMMWSMQEVERRLHEETDFQREGHNADLARSDLSTLGDKWLRSNVYIPQVYWNETSKEDVMELMVSLFAFQIFVSGNVHGDPHPGNMLIRQHPDRKHRKTPQLVLLDHGLYIRESSQFKRQYAEFWRAAMVNDKAEMSRIVWNWGMADSGMFSTMVSLRPPGASGHPHSNARSSPSAKDETASGGSEDSDSAASRRAYSEQMEFKKRAIAALKGSRRLPQELVFVTRNMNIVRANNRSLGIPVNRIHILGQYAAYGLRRMLVDEALSSSRRFDRTRGVVRSRDMLLSRLVGLVAGEWSYWTFKLAVWATTAGLALYDMWGRVASLIAGKPRPKDFEDLLDENMRKMMAKKLGYEIDTSLFSA
ncbi:ABC1-domain-containing protein [Martensiomyces pterosporus]|nr:ABC1-domain-containing protein [Martensiomyces pterosporus]